MVYERRKTRLGGVSYRKNLGDRERVSKKIHTYYILVYFPHIILPFFPYILVHRLLVGRICIRLTTLLFSLGNIYTGNY